VAAPHASADRERLRTRAPLSWLALAALVLASCDDTPVEPLGPGAALLEELAAAFPAPPLGPPEWRGFGELSDVRAGLAVREAELMLQHRAEPSADTALALGRIYTRAEELARGMGFLLEALEGLPESAEPWLWMGINRLSASAHAHALALFAEAEASGAGDARLWRYRGEVHLREQDEERARADFARAIAAGPRFPGGAPEDDTDCRSSFGEALLAHAALEQERGALPEARAELERFLSEIEDVHPEALFRLERVLRELGEAQAADEVARRHARAALMDDLRLLLPEYSRAQRRVSLAIHHLGQESIEEAMLEFEGALEAGADPQSHAMALVGLADCLLRRSRLAEARVRIAELERFQPDHPLLPDLRELAGL